MSKHVVQRVYSAMHQMRRDHIPLENFVIHAHPSVVADVERDPHHFMWITQDGEKRTFGGLPLEVDPTLEKDGIVLRYEVVA